MRMMRRRWVGIMMRSSISMMAGKGGMMMKEEGGMIIRFMGGRVGWRGRDGLWSFEEICLPTSVALWRFGNLECDRYLNHSVCIYTMINLPRSIRLEALHAFRLSFRGFNHSSCSIPGDIFGRLRVNEVHRKLVR